MARLDLFLPAKPFTVTQAFGIYNPAYERFGFSYHNGVDFSVDEDGIVRAMCDGEVYETGFNDGAGNFVRYKTGPVEAEGKTGTVGFMYMHADKILVAKGQKVQAGDPIIVADNTGFSTGPHTHISAYFINELDIKIPLNPLTDHCFDWFKYTNGKYADDILIALQLQITKLIQQILSILATKLGFK